MLFIIRLAATLLLAILTLIGLANLADIEWSLLKRLVHFPIYWAPLALLLACGFAIAHRWKTALLAILVSAGFASQLALLWAPPVVTARQSNTTTTHTPLTVLAFNVRQSNRHHTEVLHALQKADADVVYLTELTADWHTALQPLEQQYPHRLGLPGKSDRLLSKFPLDKAEVVSLTYEAAQKAPAATPSDLPGWLKDTWNRDDLLVATVILPTGSRIRIAGLHPPTPMNTPRLTQQRACIPLYAAALTADPGASTRILMGDFNNSVFSPTFRHLLRITALQDTAQGRGYTPTWGPMVQKKSWLPWLGIPIDYILASTDVTVHHHEVGPELGSDHRWVKATLLIP